MYQSNKSLIELINKQFVFNIPNHAFERYKQRLSQTTLNKRCKNIKAIKAENITKELFNNKAKLVFYNSKEVECQNYDNIIIKACRSENLLYIFKKKKDGPKPVIVLLTVEPYHWQRKKITDIKLAERFRG